MFIEELAQKETVTAGAFKVSCTHRSIGVRSHEPHNRVLSLYEIPGIVREGVFVAVPGAEREVRIEGEEYDELADSDDLYAYFLRLWDAAVAARAVFIENEEADGGEE